MHKEHNMESNDKNKRETHRKESSSKESSKENNKIVFSSLSPLEQERLISRLKEQIVDSHSIMNGRCCMFCGWLCGSFLANAAKPAPTVLTQNLEYIENNYAEPDDVDEPDRIFYEGGDETKIEEYHMAIKENKALDLFEAEIYSLAIASRRYMEEEIHFIDEGTYRKAVELIKDGQNEFVIERLPFLMNQRPMVKLILERAKEENHKEFYEDWGQVLFKFQENREINGKITQMLTEAEFDEVDEKFF